MNMNPILRTVGMAVLLASLTACTKKETETAATPKAPGPPKPTTVAVVPEPERSRHFLAVQKQLELGGTVYGYVDVDGDARKLAAGLQGVMDQMAATQPQLAPFVKQDYAALFDLLGLGDIKAVGLSSVPDGTGFFRNRVFFYTPEKRHGLLAGLGGGPAPFARLGLAPADADLYSESEVDLPEVYKTIKAVVAKVGGKKTSNLMEDQLKKAGEAAAISVLGLIQGWKGQSALVVRLDPEHTLQFPGSQSFVAPRPELMLSIDGIALALESALAKSPLFAARTEGGLTLYEFKQPLPLNGIKPVLAVEGTTLYFATTVEFLLECRQNKGGLTQTAEFKQAIAHVGELGNGLTYVSPRLFKTLHSLENLNPTLPPETRQTLHFVVSQLPKPDRALIAVRTNLPEGILVNSYWSRSLKQDLATVSVYNPITVGMLAAMAIPAFQKVRASSQEKAVLNNLRQLAAAADQHYLETGANHATLNDLVGPTKYIRQLRPVGGEDYRALVFRQGEPLRVFVPSLRKAVEYGP
jgi:type IV pilus assembly protein PilA